MSNTQRNSSSALQGWAGIGGYINRKAEAAEYLARTQNLPFFKIGRQVWSTREMIDEWIAERSRHLGSLGPGPAREAREPQAA